MNWGIIGGFIVIAAVIGAGYLACCTDTVVGALNRYARARDGEWRQRKFWCPGCDKARHIARPGPTGMTQCVHCTPVPRHPGGAR